MQKTKLAVLMGMVTIAAAVLAAQEVSQEIRIVTAGGGGMAGALAGDAGRALPPIAMGTGLIYGQAVESESNRPVPGALVTLGLPGATPIRVMADGQGRFAFRDLPKGRYTLSVVKAGWVDGAYGRSRPDGPSQPVTLDDGARVSGIAIPLWRYAAIAGTVRDELGEPIVNQPVRILRRTVVGGQWRLVSGPMDMTDDRGAYRVGSLEPGQYVVAVPMQQNDGLSIDIPVDVPAAAAQAREIMVTARSQAGATGGGDGPMFFQAIGPGGAPAGMSEDGHPLAYPTVFYPSAASASRASLVAVGAGEERNGVDFELKPVRTVRVSGIATGPNGPAANLRVMLLPAESQEMVSSIEILTAVASGAGQFTFNAVPPGEYTLRAVLMPRAPMPVGEVTTIQQGGMVMMTRIATSTGQAPLPTDPTLWAEMPLSLGDKDVADLSVGLRAGVRVSGGVQFDGAAARPTGDQLASSIGITLEPADARPGATAARGRMEKTGQFTTMGVPPGRYILRVRSGLPGWTLRAALANGRDISDTPIELDSSDVAGVILSFTDRTSELSGQVTLDTGTDEATTVMVFPTDPSAWIGYGSVSKRLVTTRADKTGNFSFQNLPGGDYYVVAVPDRQAGDWPNPTYLEQLATVATRVRVRDGEKVTQTLKVIR